MKTKILIIHPGFPKTGTTSFQEILRLLNVNILAKPCEIQTSTTWFKLFKSHFFISKNPKPYNYYELKKNFKDYLKIFFNNQKAVSVFSDETILGPITAGSLGLNNLYIFNEIIKEIETELNIKIIIKFVVTIRKQYNYITSTFYYDEYFHKIMSIKEFYEKIIKSKDFRNNFEYIFVVKKIKEIFKSEILILPLELLEKDQKKYIYEFCEFINLDAREVQISKKKHENKNYFLKNSEKNYFFRETVYNRNVYSLFSFIHNQLKKIDIYNKNFRNNVLLKFIYQSIKSKTKKTLAKKNNDLLLYQDKIKLVFKENNLYLESLTNIKLKDFDYY